MDSQRFEEIEQHYAGYNGLHAGTIRELIAEVERLQAVNKQLLNAAQDAYGVMEYISCHYYPQDTELRNATDALGIAIDRAMVEEVCPAEEVAPLPNTSGK